MNDSSAIRVLHPSEFDKGTLQTPGSERLAAVAPQLGVESTMWGGMFEVKPGARTGIHHHGEQQTIAYVLSGACEMRWGRTASSQRAPESATSFTCPHSPRIWRSIRQLRNRSDGSW
jgi:uncharacterized RmlC-like cupin family protein